MFVDVPPFRWFCKKIARKSMALGSQYSGSLALAGYLSREPGVRVLTYHRFGDSPYDPFCVSAKHFEQQMAFIAKNHLAISFTDFEKHLKGELRLSKEAVLVTVDDGFQSLYKIALPILKKYAIPAVAFVTPSLIHDAVSMNRLSAGQPEPYMDWEEVIDLANNNVVIGSHAWTHRSLGTLDDNEVMEEAVLSRQALESKLSRPVTSFAYPFGTKADFNTKTFRILEEAGYICAFTSQHGAIKKQLNPYDLPRVKVEGGEAIWVFRSLVKGGLDAWRLIDQTLWRLQANRNA
jgi:peptidoglycan/xylan/chitin deacetylase (PgdA/CDA1 family)